MVFLKILSPIIDSQFNESKVGKGILFFLLPFLLLLGFSLFIGINVNFVELLLAIVKEFAYWIFASIVLFVLLIAFKGKEVHGKFSSIMAGFSVTFLVNFVMALLSFLVVFLAIPNFFRKIATLQGKELSFEQILSVINSMAMPSQEIVIILFILLLAIGIIAVISNLFVVYKIGNLVRKTTAFSNWVFVIVYFGLSFLINSLLSFIFGLI